MPTFLYRKEGEVEAKEVDESFLSEAFGRKIYWVDFPFKGKRPERTKEDENRRYLDFTIVKSKDESLGHYIVANRPFKKGETLFNYAGQIVTSEYSPSTHAHPISALGKDTWVDGYNFTNFGSFMLGLPTKEDLDTYKCELLEKKEEVAPQIATANISAQLEVKGKRILVPCIALRDIKAGEALGENYFTTEYFGYKFSEQNKQPRIFYTSGDVIPLDRYQVNMPRVILPTAENNNNCIEMHIPRNRLANFVNAGGELRSFISQDVHSKNLHDIPTSAPSTLAFAYQGEVQASAFNVGLKPVPVKDITIHKKDHFKNTPKKLLDDLLRQIPGIPLDLNWKYPEKYCRTFALDLAKVGDNGQEILEKILQPFGFKIMQAQQNPGQKYMLINMEMLELTSLKKAIINAPKIVQQYKDKAQAPKMAPAESGKATQGGFFANNDVIASDNVKTKAIKSTAETKMEPGTTRVTGKFLQ